MRWEDLKKRLGVSSVTVWRWERDGIFPKRVKLGPGTVGWLESEVDGYFERIAAER
ncbi:AlpA family phage regulatory protein [Desulfosarcina cetonica]|uniref:helix-turn-helix transcriptional regulator n=1 Tax=Desulfosarcina cetonica TaxID=90730 RepID=UPI0009FA0083